MSFFEDYWKKFTGKDLDLSDISFSDVASAGANMFVANKLNDYTRVQKPKVGYQGKIEDLTAVRERVNQPDAPTEGRNVGIMSGDDNMAGDMYRKGEERRPGGKGRRYFSDTIFAKKEKTDPMSEEDAVKAARRQALELEGKSEEEIEQIMNPTPEPVAAATGGHLRRYAQGGIASAHNGYYLGGKTDGMADKVPARIDGKQEARLSDGEFVIPADVVSHLGNGNSDAGAQQLHNMMDGVRQARTGNPEQGKQIDPQKFMPKMAQGGLAQFAGGGNVNAVQGVNSRFKNQPYTTHFQGEGKDPTGDTEGTVDPSPIGEGEIAGSEIGYESSLSNWAGDYVTDMLAQGKALGNQGYEAYEGPLTAGSSFLQDQAITGLMHLSNPLGGTSVTKDMGTFTPDQATLDPYMNPYTQNVIDRTAADMRRQSQIDALQDRTAMTQAGAFGGSRDALMRAERAGILSSQIGDMAAEQRALNFSQAMDRAKASQEMANQYGFDVLAAQGAAGQVQRDIASEGIAADYAQFREERDYPYKNVQYMQSLLQGLPIEAQSSVYSEPSELQQYFDTAGGLEAYLKYLGATENEAETNNTSDTTADTTAPAAEEDPDMANPYRESNIQEQINEY